MFFNIREEKPTDYNKVFNLIKKAFEKVEISDHKEHFLVNRLRKSSAFVPELSIVAEYQNKIIGHILLTKVGIQNDKHFHKSLTLAPVSVLPGFQKKGVGSHLIKYAHERARELNFNSIVLLGHDKYYCKFGYKPSDEFGIIFPFDAPKDNCMALELTPNGLKYVNGLVVYPKEFFDE